MKVDRSVLVDSVANLTDSRDREALEVTLASVMSELIDASSLTLWRVVPRNGELMVRQRVRFGAHGVSVGFEPGAAGSNVMLPLASRTDLLTAYNTKSAFRTALDNHGGARHVFPVSSGREIISLFEIQCATPLSCDHERLAIGMLRVFKNHVGMLDYGDRDGLTGLLNRRTFDESFKRALASERAASGLRPGVAGGRRRLLRRKPRSHVAVIDIDFFKRVNDRFGHPIGDEVLILLARLMTESFRDRDQLFRFGGEEFVVILSDVTLREANCALERFRAKVEASHFPQVGLVTVSIGHAAIMPGDNGTAAFGRADTALFWAKANGRNRVLSFDGLAKSGDFAANSSDSHDVELF